MADDDRLPSGTKARPGGEYARSVRRSVSLPPFIRREAARFDPTMADVEAYEAAVASARGNPVGWIKPE